MNKIFCLVAWALSLSAFASTPLFSIVPIGTLPTSVYVLNPLVTASYTVTNNSIYPLKGNGLVYPPVGQTPVGVTQVTGGAGVCANPFNLAPGASCILNLSINGNAFSGGKAIGGPEVCNTPANPVHCSLPDLDNRLNLAFTNFPPLLVTGKDVTNNFAFFIENQNPLSSNWTLGATPTVPSNSNFTSASCTEVFCAISGVTNTSTPFGGPLLISSVDGVTWTLASLGATQTVLSGVSCTPGTLGLCVAAGTEVGVLPTMGAAYQYSASAPAWTSIPLLASVSSAELKNVYCSASNCLVIGDASYVPLLYLTSNNGVSWSTVTPSGTAPANPVLSGELGNDGSNYLAVYWSTTGGLPLQYALSTNAGSTWAWTVATGTDELSTQSMACTPGFCYVGGYNFSTHDILLAKVVTPYGAGNWTLPALPAPVNGAVGNLRSLDCGTSFCVGVGDISSVQAFLIQSIGGGAFVNVSLPGLTSSAVLETVSCTNTYCWAAGTDNGSGILFETTNSGTTWSQVNITGILPLHSSFSGSFSVPNVP